MDLQVCLGTLELLAREDLLECEDLLDLLDHSGSWETLESAANRAMTDLLDPRVMLETWAREARQVRKVLMETLEYRDPPDLLDCEDFLGDPAWLDQLGNQAKQESQGKMEKMESLDLEEYPAWLEDRGVLETLARWG